MLTLIISCAKPKLEELITVPDGYYLTVENNPEKNSELKAKWLAEDVAYVVYEPEFRKNAKNILTISKYSKQDYSYWLDRYLDDKIVQFRNESLTIECNFSSIIEKNIQEKYTRNSRSNWFFYWSSSRRYHFSCNNKT